MDEWCENIWLDLGEFSVDFDLSQQLCRLINIIEHIMKYFHSVILATLDVLCFEYRGISAVALIQGLNDTIAMVFLELFPQYLVAIEGGDVCLLKFHLCNNKDYNYKDDLMFGIK